jgi:uncharacterized protein (DUF885 family)
VRYLLVMFRLRIGFISSIVSLAIVASCSGYQQRRSSSNPFENFVEDYFQAAFEFSPTNAVGQGFHAYDGRIELRNEAAYQARLAGQQGFRLRLDRLMPQLQTANEKIDATMISNDIDSDLLQLQTLQSWRHNPMGYVGLPGSAIDAMMKRDFAPALQRLENATERLEGVPAILQAMRDNVSNPPKEFTDIAIQIAAGSVSYFKNDVAIWAKSSAGGDQDALARFTAANTAAIAAMEKAAAWLKDTLLPQSKGNFAIGADNFARQLLVEEMVDIPLARLLQIGEANLAKDAEQFVAVAKTINATQTPAEVMTHLSDEHPTAASLISDAKGTLAAAREFLISHHIVTLPTELPLSVEETPPYARNGTFASMDTPGAFETKATTAFYYVTPPEADWSDQQRDEHLRLYNPPVMKIITVHEAFPGHYTQFIYSKQFPTKARRLLGASSNVEGWAHYTEQMMIDEGFGDGDAKLRLAQLSEALLRDCRFIVGIKLHTEGWTVEQGAKFFHEACFQENANAFQEARRGAYNPTYLYYTLGKLQFLKLRDDVKAARAAKGQAFSLQEFHDSIMREGPLPLKLLRTILLPGDNSPSL